MGESLNILLLEDCADDAQLILRQLRRGGHDIRESLVDNAADLQAALDRQTWDVVIADYALPGFNGLAALQLVRARFPDLPFLIVSGAIGEEAAVAAVKAGANDYLMKDRLSRLPMAVARELEAAATRRASRQAAADLLEHSEKLETLNQIGRLLTSELDQERLVQAITDAGKQLTGAEFGAFFYNVINDKGESYVLYALAGAPREAFSQFPMPRNTALFRPTFEGTGIVRVADVHEDPRYGLEAPFHGLPPGHLPVASYLAVPVTSRSGDVLGGLFFGHQNRDVFSEQSERVVAGLAAQAAVALDNARLFRSVENELTERKRTETALRESGDRLRLALDNSGHGMWDWDIPSGRVVLDDNWHTIQGYQPGELPLVVQSWEQSLHPDDKERVFAVLHEHLDSTESLYDVDYRSRHASGEWIWINSRGRVVQRDAGGKPLRMMGTSHDITHRKLAEANLSRRAEELARSNAELEQFAYVASHDLREPLRMVQSFCSLLKDRYSDRLDERANKYIDFAVDGAARMQRLVDDLLEFSRVGRSNERFEVVSLEVIARQALENVAAAVEESGARVAIGELPIVHGDAARLEQVLQNLIGNAIKFRGASPPEVRIFANRESDQWRITVADNGIGINPEHFQRLFIVFQRLHARDDYDGTGIGLALCKRIVELHGGRIWLESQPGQGTSVHFQLLPANQSSNRVEEDVECALQLTAS